MPLCTIPAACWPNAEGGTVAIFADNAPAFYAITPQRLAQLLELEARLSRPSSDVTLDNQFFDEPTSAPDCGADGQIRHV
ncbi:Primosomal protein I [Leclercia adecarboxylata]|uniref:Primosomal protein I n=1 Tax=Leclercia adecarboxylata TaxID=83655 RepID=A0A4U9HHU4_9ENTR|nr:Primosomal protein I [Leclercia adecarboxylata]